MAELILGQIYNSLERPILADSGPSALKPVGDEADGPMSQPAMVLAPLDVRRLSKPFTEKEQANAVSAAGIPLQFRDRTPKGYGVNGWRSAASQSTRCG